MRVMVSGWATTSPVFALTVISCVETFSNSQLRIAVLSYRMSRAGV